MKSFVAHGDTITLTVPDDTANADGVASGEGLLVGSLFGVAVNDVAAGAAGPFKTTGIFDLVKVGSQAWTIGAPIYWDDANVRCTTTAGALKVIGHAMLVVGSGAGETTGRVRLKGYAG